MLKHKIALDVGDVRIGVAVSDLLGITANPRETYVRKKGDVKADIEYFCQYAKKEDAVENKLKEDLKFMDYFKSIYISAKTGQRTEKILSLVNSVYEHSRFRVATGILNDIISDAVRANEPPSYNGRRLKVYYSSQVAVAPPTFVLFVNSTDLLHFSYERFLENTLRKSFDFSGTPIKILTREKKND